MKIEIEIFSKEELLAKGRILGNIRKKELAKVAADEAVKTYRALAVKKKGYVTIHEVAAATGKSTKTIRRYMNQNGLRVLQGLICT